jgi:hypothetical protein
MYSFEHFIDDVKHGREIEFRINGVAYSVTNTKTGWQVAENNRLIVNDVADNDLMIEILKKEVVLNGKSMKAVFDDQLYDKKSLYIL